MCTYWTGQCGPRWAGCRHPNPFRNGRPGRNSTKCLALSSLQHRSLQGWRSRESGGRNSGRKNVRRTHQKQRHSHKPTHGLSFNKLELLCHWNPRAQVAVSYWYMRSYLRIQSNLRALQSKNNLPSTGPVEWKDKKETLHHQQQHSYICRLPTQIYEKTDRQIHA